MYSRRCRHFNQDTGEPIGSGCPRGDRCEFIHPRSSHWDEARPSRPVARQQRYSERRTRSDSVSSSGDSSRYHARMPQSHWPSSRYNERQPPKDLLSSRLSDPNSLGSRLNAPASPPSPARETLSSRIQDPPQQTSSLTSRISELPAAPAPPASSSSWATSSVSAAGNKLGSGHARAESSGWGEPGDVHLSWSDSAAKPAPVPPSRPRGHSPQTAKNSSREPSFASALESSMHHKERQLSMSISSSTSGPTPTLERQPSRPAVPSLPAPPPQRPPSLPASQPQQPSAPSPSFPSPITPMLPLPTTPITTVPSAQMQPLEVSRPVDQRPTEVAEGKNASNDARQRSVEVERMENVCEASLQYLKYHKAMEMKYNMNHKQPRISIGGQQKISNSTQEAEVKIKEERSKWHESVHKLSTNWPYTPPKDNRLENANRQLQALKQQVQVIEDTLNSENTSEKDDSMTIEQIVARQSNLAERLEEIEEHQADVENDVEQRLDDLTQRHGDSFEDLNSNALTEVKKSTDQSKLLQKSMDQLTKNHEAFSQQVDQIYSRQDDILEKSNKLHEENEELKRRLAIYEARDISYRKQLDVAVEAMAKLKQESLNMQDRTQQLAENLKTIVMSQAREHLEEQFSLVKQEIDMQLKTTKETFVKEFRGKYGPAFSLLEQLSTHLQNAFSESN